MIYRTLGRTGLRVSEIGLGTEYLINKPREEIIAVIHEAIAQGINYFDLFFAQPEFRDTMGAAFKNQRKNVHLVAHLGASEKEGQYKKTRAVKTSEHYIHDFLTRYATDYVDVLMLHNCDSQKDFDKVFNPNGFLGLAQRLKTQGTARFLGFSGHTVETALQAVESGFIDVLMFPVNMTGNAIPGKKELFKTCAANDVGLVAMKPYAGGKLLQEPRTVRIARYQTKGNALKVKKTVNITPAQCLSYTLSRVGVCTAVPGCANLAQLADAVAYEQADATAKDFSEVLATFEQYKTGECVYCNHCLPCPANINIGQTLHLLNMAQSNLIPAIRADYNAMPVQADACIECGACEKRCPFEVPTVERMRQAAALFAT